MTLIALSACALDPEQSSEAARAALNGRVTDDNLVAAAGVPAVIDVFANDAPGVEIESFIVPVHGTLSFEGGVATYTSEPDYVGADIFRYTVVPEAEGSETESAVVNISVVKPATVCTIAITGPLESVYDDAVHMTANTVCDSDAVEVQWRRRINEYWEVVQPWSTSLTLDFQAPEVHPQIFYAQVRGQGSTTLLGRSNEFTVQITDTLPLCTSVTVLAPSPDAALEEGTPAMLNAAARCPGSESPPAEYQFWVKTRAEQHVWTVITEFSTDATASWTPTEPGEWQIKVVARAITSHARYQVHSAVVNVTVTPSDDTLR